MKRFVFVSQLYLVLAQLPVYILWKRTPSNTVFPLVNISQAIADFYGYLAAMTMGARGHLLYRNPYTSEPTPTSILYLFYTVTGNIAAHLHLWIPMAYLILNILSIELFFLGLFLLMRQVLGKKVGPWASLAAVMLTISPPALYQTKDAFVTFTPWWANLDGVYRITEAPHHMMGEALLLFALFFFFSWINSRKLWQLMAAVSSSVVSGIIFSPMMLVLTVALPVSVVITLLRSRWQPGSFRLTRQLFLGTSLLIGTAGVIMGMMVLQTRSDYFKTIWVTWEVQRWNVLQGDFNSNMMVSFFPLLFLSLPALVVAIRKNQWVGIFFSVWAWLPFLLLPLANPLEISKMRLLSTAPYVPLGYLIAASFFQVLPKRVGIPGAIILALWTVYMSGTLTYQRVAYSRAMPIYSNIYFSDDMWQTMTFLGNNAPVDSVVLSSGTAGAIIPAFTPLISYFGHVNLTLNYPEKEANMTSFYHQDLSAAEAASFLRTNRIRYVYVGPEEQSILGTDLTYPFLKELFRKGNVVVYERK